MIAGGSAREPSVATTKRAGFDTRRRALARSAARARHEEPRCGDAGGRPNEARHPTSPPLAQRTSDAPLRNLCKRNTDCAIACRQPTRFVIDLHSSRYKRHLISYRGEKMADFCLRFGVTDGVQADQSEGPGVRRAWTVQRARRAPWVRVYLFTYVYVVEVNKGASNLCKTPVNLSRSKRCGRHNPCAACGGTRGCNA